MELIITETEAKFYYNKYQKENNKIEENDISKIVKEILFKEEIIVILFFYLDNTNYSPYFKIIARMRKIKS